MSMRAGLVGAGLAVLLLAACGGGAAQTTPAAGAGATTPEETRFGPTYTVKDRIVNLADPGGRRYLRFSAAIEFAPSPTVTASKDPDKTFQTVVKPYVPVIEDVVTTVLSEKTYEDVRTPEGKDHVKQEIEQRLQAQLGDAERVTNVYFPDFVVQ
jgi:flagellar FliL protein